MRRAAIAAAVLAFAAAPADAGTVEVVDVATGNVRTVGTFTSDEHLSFSASAVRWDPDGASLRLAAGTAERFGILRVPVDGTRARARMVRRLGTYDGGLSPDGRTAYDVVAGEGLRYRDVATGRVLWRAPAHFEGVIFGSAETHFVTWSADGSRLTVMGRETEASRPTLRVLDARSGRLLLRVRSTRGRLLGAALLSPTGDRLLVPGERRHRVYDVASGRGTAGEVSVGVAPFPLAWSPAGDQILYAGADAFVLGASGPVLPAGAGIADAAFSPDGTRVAFQPMRSADQEQVGIAWMPVLPPYAAPRVLVKPGRRVVGPPAWSPDGTRIAFATEPVS